MTRLATPRQSRRAALGVRAAGLLVAAMLGGCRAAPSTGPAPFTTEVDVHALGDDGRPLEHVRLLRGERTLGETSNDGVLRVTVQGTEGQSLPLGVGCPAGFLEQKEPRMVRLARTRSVGNVARAPVKLEVVCERLQRDVVLAVRATGGAGLPVTVNGERAAVTDAAGIAHVLLHVDRAVRTLEVELDTHERKELAGQGSRRLLELGPGDTVLFVDQTYSAPRPVVRSTRPAPAPSHHAPTRID